MADQDCPALGAVDRQVRLRECSVVLGRGRHVGRAAQIAEQGALAVGAVDHNVTSLISARGQVLPREGVQPNRIRERKFRLVAAGLLVLSADRLVGAQAAADLAHRLTKPVLVFDQCQPQIALAGFPKTAAGAHNHIGILD